MDPERQGYSDATSTRDLTIASMSRSASRAPLASPFSKSRSVRPIWFVTWAKHRTARLRAVANA